MVQAEVKDHTEKTLKTSQQALQFCWHIRVGFFREIPLNRIEAYAGLFYRNYLLAYFTIQEKAMRDVYGGKDAVFKKMLAKQRRLKRLFEDTSSARSLCLIEDLLENYTYFEQRVLFKPLPDANIHLERFKHEYLLIYQAYAKKRAAWGDKYWELQ